MSVRPFSSNGKQVAETLASVVLTHSRGANGQFCDVSTRVGLVRGRCCRVLREARGKSKSVAR